MDLRSLPSVDRVVRELGDITLPRPALVALVRRELASIRKIGGKSGLKDPWAQIRAAIRDLTLTRIQPVINGTGIIVHTNLGRAPLAAEAVNTVNDVAAHYTNLEYDLTGGARGTRAAYLEHNLAVLCNAEAATVVNNCAAALVLMLRHFATPDRPQVVISRGELVQIGGGFRIPDVLESSGATLREIGTTNRTSISDYGRAIGKQTGLVLRVHRSNFFMGGFVESPSTSEIAAVAKAKKVPFVEDLGSGAVFPTEQTGPAVEHEPTPAEVLGDGANLICFSGDKLLGGPQAGIIAGRAKYVAALKREPFFRALRCDKLILAALQETVDLHLRGATVSGNNALIPVEGMMRTPTDVLRLRAQAMVDALQGVPATATVGSGQAQIGGGSLPRSTIASVTLDLKPSERSVDDLATALRAGVPPVIGYVSRGRFKLDLRTIFPSQDIRVIDALRVALSATSS